MNRTKLQTDLVNLLKEVKNLSEEEVSTLAITISTLVFSAKDTRTLWYRKMSEVAEFITEYLNSQAEAILSVLNLSEEEEKELMDKLNNKKMEN